MTHPPPYTLPPLLLQIHSTHRLPQLHLTDSIPLTFHITKGAPQKRSRFTSALSSAANPAKRQKTTTTATRATDIVRVSYAGQEFARLQQADALIVTGGYMTIKEARIVGEEWGRTQHTIYNDRRSGVKPLQEFLIEVTFEIPAKSMMEPASLGLQDGAMQQQEEEDIEPRKRATMHILNKMGLLQGDASDHKQTTWEQTPVRKKLDTKLKVELRDYQQQALAFMCYREEDRECPVPGFVYVLPGLWLQTATATFRSAEPSRQQSKGGILGDEMGLGKTVETLALISHTRPPIKHPLSKPKPGQLPEINATLIVAPMSLITQWKEEAESKTDLKVMMHYGDQRMTEHQLLAAAPDIVLSSYGTVASDFGNDKGVFKLNWFRVCLDEAHYIKNRATVTAKSVCQLTAERRWVITGTPLQNNLEDLHSLLKFLRYEPYCNFSVFNTQILVPFTTDPHAALQVVTSVIAPILLRRTKNTLDENGNPIVTLPEKAVDLVSLDFDSEERLIYDTLWKRTQAKFTSYCATGNVLKHWAHVFQMIMRLRQCSNHPSLALGQNSEEGVGTDVMDLINKFSGGEGFEGNVLSSSGEEECPFCLDTMVAPTLYKSCGHMSCYQCVLLYLEKREAEGKAGECPKCRAVLSPADLFEVVTSKDPDAAPSIRRHFRSSSKLTAMLELVKKAPADDKLVVFSQFTSMLKLAAIVLSDDSIGFATIDGSMSRENRSAQLTQFQNDPKKRVLLASSRVAGVGLNLVMANHVIMLEPWWNAPVENQTIDRVHRIGQTKKVTVSRFVMKDSIEERMIQIQTRKSLLVSLAVQSEGEDLLDDSDMLKSETTEEKRAKRIDQLKALFA